MASLVRFLVARRHCLGITDAVRESETQPDEEILSRERKSDAPLHVCRDKENVGTRARGIISSDVAFPDRTGKERDRQHLAARKAWAKSSLISENTRRISGLIRRRLTAPIRFSRLRAREAIDGEEVENRTKDEWR